MKRRATVERKSEREVVVTQTINGPVHLVFEAWTRPELFRQWWVPKSFPVLLLSCEMDARTGGKYRLVFGSEGAEPMEFFGRYIDVRQNSRIVWTNEEGQEEGPVTTVTFEDQGDRTLLVIHDLYPSKKALEDGIASGSIDAMPETLEQLDALIVTLGASAGRS